MRRMTLASLLAALLAMTMGIGGALAAPEKSPYADWITLDCEGETIEVVTASGNPAFVVDSTDRLIPYEWHFEFVAVAGEDEIPLFEETYPVGKGQKKGLQDRMITCTYELEIAIEDLSPEERAFLEETSGLDLEDVDAIIGYGSVKGVYAPPR